MPLPGMDTSHYQGRPNLAAFKAWGGAFVIAKATQGTTFRDPEFATTRSDAHAVGVVFGAYHFANWGDPVAEANFFLSVVRPRPGELIMLDAEGVIPAGVNVAAWSDTWSRVVKAATGCPPLIYMNSSWLAGHDWRAVLADNDGLVLAKYDGPTASENTGIWPTMAFKQWTDRASIPGVVGPVDEDEFFGDLAGLLRYAVPAKPTPPPPPPPPPPPSDWFDMATQADLTAAIAQFFPTGYDRSWLEDILRRVQSMHLYDYGPFDPKSAPTPLPTAGGHPPVVTLDAASITALKDSIVADPTFQALVEAAATAATAAVDADLAKRFGTPGA